MAIHAQMHLEDLLQAFGAPRQRRDIARIRRAVRMQFMQKIFPWHVKTMRCSTDTCSMCLLLHMLTKQMTLIAFHVTHKHAGPAWLHNRCFNPGHLILEEEAGRVAPKIVVRQDHGHICGRLVHDTACTIFA